MKILMLLAKNRIAARWILLALVFLFVFALCFFDIPVIILLLIYFALMFIVYIFVEVYTPAIIQQKYVNMLINDCDPFPLLKVSEELLSYDINPGVRKNILINYCVALRNTGDYEKTYEALKSIDLDSFHENDISTKLICLNNLSDICSLLDKPEESLDYAQRLIELYEKMPEGRLKNILKPSIQGIYADRCFLLGEYDKALEMAQNHKTKNRCSEIQLYVFLGKIHLKLGDTENARQCLNFAVTNGNKLYSVVEAKAILANMQ